MAQIFLAYASSDRPLARLIEKGLQSLGHECVWGVDEVIAGRGWGELMPQRIATADAIVALMTPAAIDSASVWCEVGAARVLANTERRTALLPVILGLERAPSYARDILVLWAEPIPIEQDMDRLVGEIDRAIGAHLSSIQTEENRTPSPKIFISHRHKDRAVAKALTEALTAAFELAERDIRCTSVQPYRLPFGKNTGERLRDEIRGAKAVLGILSPDTAESSYVMFELGAAWGQRIYTCPLLSKGANFNDIPGPIFDLSPARLWVESDGQQLLRDLEVEIDLTPRPDTNEKTSAKITALAAAAESVGEVLST